MSHIICFSALVHYQYYKICSDKSIRCIIVESYMIVKRLYIKIFFILFKQHTILTYLIKLAPQMITKLLSTENRSMTIHICIEKTHVNVLTIVNNAMKSGYKK